MNFILLPEKLNAKEIWGQLYGSSLSIVLAEYCKNQPGIKVIVAEDNLAASQIYAEIKFFLPPDNPNSPEILYFPDWETLPYDQFSPHQDIISQRLFTLNRVQQGGNLIVISAISTLMHKLCPPEFLLQYAFVLKQGQSLQIETFRQQLQQAGYHCVNKVLEHGEFAIRGSILDLYPMGSKLPYRIELFDDTVESLRIFDPDSQRTIDKISSINILPAREFPLNENSISLFRQNYREAFPGNPSLSPIYEAISEARFPNGIEYYLPLFFNSTSTFFDYLPDASSVCLIDKISDQAESFWREVESRYEQRSYDISRPILQPEKLFLRPSEILGLINKFQQLRLYHEPIEKKGGVNFATNKAPNLYVERHAPLPLKNLVNYLNSAENRFLLIVESAGRREILLDLLKSHQIYPTIHNSWEEFLTHDSKYNILVAPFAQGCEIKKHSITIIVEAQLFGENSVVQTRPTQRNIDPDLIIKDLAELHIGAPVVHNEFGVGRYQGLQYIDNAGIENEFLVLSYADNDKIYVLVTSLNVITRYTGADAEHAPLHKLGGEQWQKEKKKAAEKIHDIAIELLDTYAKREAKPGHTYSFNPIEYHKFVANFPFTETADQLNAMEQIIADMQSTRPMDRLICGDVGFGKTEVAMRAAFIAVLNSKQVCVLTPTTLLAGQHFETFRDRFAEFPVTINLLSRFRSTKESSEVISALQTGKVDIVIGTHKLLQKGIDFKNLGLLIIDEEHRFGVKQKEYIKSLRNNIDILSMTATPIPRTLNMAMAGIRDISLIATPPAKRLAIKTFWQEKNDITIREAILREILRGGQVFYLHNNVQSIERVATELQKLVPEAKINIAHGQMPEKNLERIMSDFYHHRFNVLVCTTIIETGIDVPTANTIIIDRADKFGLAQLHQLRGRVGRSHHQAYAYLLTPNEKLISSDAIKRLEAIVSLEDLGAGFTLATHDLEIRGAGELLGEEQSGNMHAIGFNLFMELLDKAVTDLKAGKTPELATPMHQGTEIDLGLSAVIPEKYIDDIHTRLIMYKRIANAKNKETLNTLQAEMIDRFGLLPLNVKHLFLVTNLKLQAEKLGILKIRMAGQEGKIEFSENPNINTKNLIQLIQMQAQRYKMKGPTQLQFTIEPTNPEEKIFAISEILQKLQ